MHGSRVTAYTLVWAILFGIPGTGIADDAFQPLFNGKDLTGWTIVQRDPKDSTQTNPDPLTVWTVQDGVLRCSGKPNGYIATRQPYENYVLELEWRWPEAHDRLNSGVLLHVQEDNTKDWPTCFEAQMKAGFAGDLWMTYPPKVAIQVDPAQHDPAQPRRFLRLAGEEKPVGQWNHFSITCKGDTLRIELNGKLTVAGAKASLRKGRIALQSEGVPVEFRNIRLKSTKP